MLCLSDNLDSSIKTILEATVRYIMKINVLRNQYFDPENEIRKVEHKYFVILLYFSNVQTVTTSVP